MRAGTAGFGSVDILTKALQEEFPELDPARLRSAVERARAKAASAALNTEAHRFIDLHLAKVEATEEAAERAQILRDLSEHLEGERGDMDRALVVRLAAFTEAPNAADVDPLLRLARVTQRWPELPLDGLLAMIDTTAEGSARRLTDLATAWQARGDAYRAADCLERALAVEPTHAAANDALELFYRSQREWPVLIELLHRRALHVTDKERGELLREIAVIYERDLGDDRGAFDAYKEADQLDPDHGEVLDAIARLAVRLGDSEEDALAALDRLTKLVTEPKKRAAILFRAAEIAKNHDWDKTQQLFERARIDDPDFAPAVEGFVTLLRDRGQLDNAIAVLLEAAERPAFAAERSRWLTDAADFSVANGDLARARGLYRQARDLDPGNHKAGAALVELCWEAGALVELVPILDDLCKNTHEPSRLREYLLQRRRVAVELKDSAAARQALTRAVELDPHDPATRRELADLLFEGGEWAAARELIEGLLDDHEGLLDTEVSAELHYRVARCARELGDHEGAAKHAAVTLALAPDHRPALLLRGELELPDSDTQLADMLQLANTAPPEERGARFAALGDRYAVLGDRGTAREMYREALSSRPNDHLLLTKFLGLVTEEGDWSYALDLVQRLIDTEQDRKVRARYRNLAAMISRDELYKRDAATALFEHAIEDDPMLFSAADELEDMLGGDELVAFYYKRLGHMRDDEGRSGERLRLWDKLGELCLTLTRRDDAIVAFEVGLSLAPDDAARRERLADLQLESGPKYTQAAIHQHQAVLRDHKKRMTSYEALRTLYRRSGQPDKARACDEAVSVIGMHVVENKIDALFGRPSSSETGGAHRTLSTEDWLALSKLDVDVQLSALFALVAPAFAADRARLRPPPAMPPVAPNVPTTPRDVLADVAAVFGIAPPPVLLDRDQATACTVAMRVRDGVLVPAIVLGRPALDNAVDHRELAFLIARQLADLRADRVARLYCPRAGELAQIVEMVAAAGAAKTSQAAQWMTAAAHQVEIDRAFAIGAKLRERNLDANRAAVDWLAATERAGDRIGFVVVGELQTCVRVLEREPSPEARVLELVWSSVTEEVLAVRSRVEGWVTAADVVSVELDGA